MKYQREDYHPWANKRSKPARREPIYMLREIADMLGIEHQEILSKIKSAVKRGLPYPKVVLRVVGGDNKRFYKKAEVIKFLEEHK
jgi:phage regulator Rha-like protein